MDQEDIEEVRDELETKRQQLKNLLEQKENASAPVTVVVKRERRLRNFSGSEAETVTEWIEDAHAMISVQVLTGKEAADYLLSHLEGPARQEVRCRPADQLNDADALFKNLRETFGERASVSQLLRNFYERKQMEGETITEYSHQLVQLIDRLENAFPDHVLYRDTMLRDQLIENVREPYLRWELKKQVTNEPESTFITCRETAIQWSTETETKKKVRTSSQIVDVKSMQSLPQQPHSDQVVKMLTEMMAKQQTLIEGIAHQQQELAKNQEELRQLASGTQRGPLSRMRSAGLCFKCRKPGHMARDCRSAGDGKGIGTCYFCGKLGHHQRECSAFKDAQVKVRCGQQTSN